MEDLACKCTYGQSTVHIVRNAQSIHSGTSLRHNNSRVLRAESNEIVGRWEFSEIILFLLAFVKMILAATLLSRAGSLGEKVCNFPLLSLISDSL